MRNVSGLKGAEAIGQMFMDLVVATDEVRCATAHANETQSLLRRLNDTWVIGQPQVVIGAKGFVGSTIEHLLGVAGRLSQPLRAKKTLFLKALQASLGLMQGVKGF